MAPETEPTLHSTGRGISSFLLLYRCPDLEGPFLELRSELHLWGHSALGQLLAWGM